MLNKNQPWKHPAFKNYSIPPTEIYYNDHSFGACWSAINTKLKIPHVIKLFYWGVIEECLTEIKTIKQLKKTDHPHLVKLIALNEKDRTLGVYYIMEEWGQKLTNLIRHIKIDSNKTIEYVIHTLRGLEKIHELGRIHRDIKPDNIFLKGDTCKIGDYGAVKLRSLSSSPSAAGTLGYMPPEMSDDYPTPEDRNKVTVDIYSTGIILRQLLTDQRPPYSQSVGNNSVCSLDNDLWAIINKATTLIPDKRYSSSIDFRTALENYRKVTKHKFKILVIDDEPSILALLQKPLEQSGYLVTIVPSGEEAINKSQQEKFDLAIIDIMLPGTDGISVLKELKKITPETESIMMTGSDDVRLAVESMKQGASDYILKPFSIDNLKKTIKKTLEKRQFNETVGLSEISRIISAAQNLDAIWETIIDIIIRTFKADDAFVVLYDEKKGLFLAVAKSLSGQIKPEHRLIIGKRLIELVSQNNEPAPFFDDFKKNNSFKGTQGFSNIKSSLVVPLIEKNEVLGILSINRIKSDKLFAALDINKAYIFASLLTLAIENESLSKKLQTTQSHFFQSQKMEAIGTLAGGVAHDFNNLLTVIQGYTDLLMMDTDKNSSAYEELGSISQAATHGRDLVRQLLLFARQQPMKTETVDINQSINNLLKMLKRLIGEDITIKTQLASDIWILQGDKSSLEQVIVNLALNARDAMPEGGNLSIKTETIVLDEKNIHNNPEAKPGKFICLSVEDTGIGMSKEIMDRLFEPFFSTKEVGKGTGLGLSVVHGIIKQHKGWVSISSEPQKGSIFRIYLPVADKQPQISPNKNISIKELKGKGERILVVEDDEQTRKFVIKALRKNGYIVTGASTKKEARELYKKAKRKFNMIFSDVILPDGNGVQLVRGLSSRNPTLKVLLSSGYTGDKSLNKGISPKKYRFLQKPYMTSELLKIIKEVFTQDK